jgi:hypothetical protein
MVEISLARSFGPSLGSAPVVRLDAVNNNHISIPFISFCSSISLRSLHGRVHLYLQLLQGLKGRQSLSSDLSDCSEIGAHSRLDILPDGT